MKLELGPKEIQIFASLETDINNLKNLNQQERKVLKAVYKHLIKENKDSLTIKVSKNDSDISSRIRDKLEDKSTQHKNRTILKKFGIFILNIFGRVTSHKLKELANEIGKTGNNTNKSNDSGIEFLKAFSANTEHEPTPLNEESSAGLGNVNLYETSSVTDLNNAEQSVADLGDIEFSIEEININALTNEEHFENIETLNSSLSEIVDKLSTIEVFYGNALQDALSGEYTQLKQEINEFKKQVTLYTQDSSTVDYRSLENMQSQINASLIELEESCIDYQKEILKQEKRDLIDVITSHLPLFRNAIDGNYLPHDLKQQVRTSINTAENLTTDNQTIDQLKEGVKNFENLAQQVESIKNENITQLEQTLSNALSQIETSLNQINIFNKYTNSPTLDLSDYIKSMNKDLNTLKAKDSKAVKDYHQLQADILILQRKINNAQETARAQLVENINLQKNRLQGMLYKALPSDRENIQSFLETLSGSQLESKNIEGLIGVHKQIRESRTIVDKSYFKKLAAASDNLRNSPPSTPNLDNISKQIVDQFWSNTEFTSSTYNKKIEDLNKRLEEHTLTNPLLNFPSDTDIDSLSNQELNSLLKSQTAKLKSYAKNRTALLQEYAECNKQFLIEFSNKYAAIFNTPENPIFYPLSPIRSIDSFIKVLTMQHNKMLSESKTSLDDLSSPELLLKKFETMQQLTTDFIHYHQEYALDNFKAFSFLGHALDFTWIQMSRYGIEPDLTHYYSLKDSLRETFSWKQAIQIDIHQTNERGEYLLDSQGNKLPSYSRAIFKTSAYIEHAKKIHKNMRDQIQSLDDKVVDILLNKEKETKDLVSSVSRNMALMKNEKHKAQIDSQFKAVNESFQEQMSSISDPKDKLLTKIVYEGILSRLFQQVMQSMAEEKI